MCVRACASVRTTHVARVCDGRLTFDLVSDEAKDYMRHCGGLTFITELLTSSTEVKVKEASLFALGSAVEHNGIASILNNPLFL